MTKPTSGASRLHLAHRRIRKSALRHALPVLLAGASILPAQALTHPGIFLTQTDLTNLRTHVNSGLDPWASAWESCRNAGTDIYYQPSVSAVMTNDYAMQNQGHAAWQLAVKWAASGDINYAIASRRIIDAWVSTVTDVTAFGPLRSGVGGAQMANAAEILAYGYNGTSGWPAVNIAAAKTWFKNVLYPEVSTGGARSANHGTSAMIGCMAIAVFCDDQTMFDDSVNAYKLGFTNTGDGYAGVTQYIDATGQNAESGRDQGHSQGGIGHLMEIAYIAWNQGVNLVTYNDSTGTVDLWGQTFGTAGANRVFIGHEYSAKYGLGNTVDYHAFNFNGQTYYPDGVSAIGRYSFSPIWEMANRLFTSAGFTPTYTRRVLDFPGYAPEYANSDHAGFGTLLYRGGSGFTRTKVDGTTAAVTYTGTWTYNGSQSNYYLNSRNQSATAGSSASWTFTGSNVRWITKKGTDNGFADVYIDNVLQAADVDCYSPTDQFKLTGFEATGLTNASHTIRVVAKGARSASSTANNVVVDAFEVPLTGPAGPSGVVTTAASSAPYTSATLDWQPSVGASSYNVKRTLTSGGPYTTLGTTAGTSYTDGTAATGLTYYYVISAVNALGEGANSVEAPATIGTIDDAAPVVTYTGTWGTQGNSSNLNDTEHYSKTGGSYAECAFTGTAINFITRTGTDSGLADIYIDGVLDAANVNTYRPAGTERYQRVVYTKTGLTNGSHVIRVLAKGTRTAPSTNNWIIIDGFSTVTPANRTKGGFATASMTGGNLLESPAQAFDSTTSSKWYTGPAAAGTGWLQYQFGPTASYAVVQYKLTSANDVPQRDPKNWELQASNDGSAWVTLDTRTNESFASRFLTKIYTISNTTAYKFYRLNITANSGGSTYGLQLSEFSLLAPQ